MLRDLRPRDGPRLFELTRVSFPEESVLLGYRPEAMEKVLHRIFRPHIRLLLALARIAGRPVFRYFVIDEGGRLVAGTLLTFTERAGYVSNVSVDPAFRRRGLARRLLLRAPEETARRRRRYVVLDVLSTNAPAIALYRSLGYRTLRTAHLWSRELGPGDAPAPPAPASRPYRPSDLPELLAAARAELPAEVDEVLPIGRGEFGATSFVDSLLAARSYPRTVEIEGRPAAYLHLSASQTQTSGSLRLVVAPSVPPEPLLPALAEGLAWARGEGAQRILAHLPDSKLAATAALRAAGFVPVYELQTLFRPASA
ncbi:MAG: GNAT family N-acetyltransferase [Thermoplasmata archaeon]